MDIIKVFGDNLKNIVQLWEYLRKHSQISVVCTELISVPLNAIAGVFRLKIFSELQMRSE